MWAKFQQFRKRLSGFRTFRFLADHLLPEWSYWVLLGLSLDVPYSILHPVRVTSALDSFTTKAILDLLSDINQKLGVTIIIITHEIGVVKQICSQVAVIESGRFAEYGVAAEVLAAPRSVAARQLIGVGGAL